MTDMDCTNCTQKGNVFTTTVPMVVLENERAHNAVIIRRMVRVIVLLVVLIFASNAFWVWRDSEYEDVVTRTQIEQDTEGGGNNYVVGGDFNGESEDYDHQEKTCP